MKKLLTLLFLIPFFATAFVLTPIQVNRYFSEQGNLTNPLSALEWLSKQNQKSERPRVDVRALSVDPSEYPLLNSLLLGAQNAVSARVTTLSGSGISSSATTIGLTSFKVTGADIELDMSDFGTLGCGTIEPGNVSRQEFISFTGITQSSADISATLTGVTRGLSPVSPYTASTTQQRSHSGASQFVISNSPPCFYENYANRTASTTVTARWIFDIYPEFKSSTVATTSNQFATKQYVDNTVSQGAATSTEDRGGLVELATLAEQANSYDGGATQPTTIQTKNSTSTCQIVGSYNIVASSTSGKLDRNCFDETSKYNLTANIGFGTSTPASRIGLQGNATVSGTTTTANLAVSSSTIAWNGITLALNTSTQPASSTVLQFNGGSSIIADKMDFQQLCEQILTSNNATSTCSWTGSATDLLIVFDIVGASGNDYPQLTFNTDYAGNGTNYGYSIFANYVENGSSSGGDKAIVFGAYATTTAQYFKISVANTASRTKMAEWDGGTKGLRKNTGIGFWNNTADQITQVNLRTNSVSQTWTSGTRLTVYGSRR